MCDNKVNKSVIRIVGRGSDICVVHDACRPPRITCLLQPCHHGLFFTETWCVAGDMRYLFLRREIAGTSVARLQCPLSSRTKLQPHYLYASTSPAEWLLATVLLPPYRIVSYSHQSCPTSTSRSRTQFFVYCNPEDLIHSMAAVQAEEMRLWAAWWACAVTKHASRRAYEAHGRAMSATHVMEHIGGVLEEIAPSPRVQG